MRDFAGSVRIPVAGTAADRAEFGFEAPGAAVVEFGFAVPVDAVVEILVVGTAAAELAELAVQQVVMVGSFRQQNSRHR